MEYSLRECWRERDGKGCAETLALIGPASFLEAFAGVLEGKDILAHCRHQHSVAKYAAWLAQPEARACLAEVKGAPVQSTGARAAGYRSIRIDHAGQYAISVK